MVTEDVTDLGGGDESQLDGIGDPETIGTTSTTRDASTAMVTPLEAELYEVEAPVTAVTAKILDADDEGDGLNTSGKMPRMSVLISVALVSILVVAGSTMGVLLPRVRKQNRDDIGGNTTDLDTSPTIEGWTPVGDVLTPEALEKDNVRFGYAVAISANGNRIAVGLPGSDNPQDESLKRTGGVRVFDLVNDTNWEVRFETFGMHSNAELGTNVALSDDGTRIAIGAPSYYSDETGYVVSDRRALSPILHRNSLFVTTSLFSHNTSVCSPPP
jgi:hypothetical protein